MEQKSGLTLHRLIKLPMHLPTAKAHNISETTKESNGVLLSVVFITFRVYKPCQTIPRLMKLSMDIHTSYKKKNYQVQVCEPQNV